MCLGKPSIPSTPPPQAVKQPDTSSLLRGQQSRAATITGGTLLTSPTGIAPGALSTGAPTLLGS